MKLQVFREEMEIEDEIYLREKLKYRHRGKYGAFWLVEDVPILALFINDCYACMYFMPNDDREAAWTKNPEFQGSQEDTVEFLIENYQLDQFPMECIISTAGAIEAFVYYYKHKKLSPEITWD